MDWVRCLNQIIRYIEENLLTNIAMEDIAANVYVSSFHLQRMFRVLTNMTVGEYIRNRRLSLAGQELVSTDVKVIDTALKYRYDTPESFSKAFKRFHGITPNQAKQEGTNLKFFNPVVIKIKLEGGIIMDYRIETKEAFTVLGMSRTFVSETSGEEIPKFWNEFYKKGYGNTVCGMFGICIQMSPGVQEYKYSIADECAPDAIVPEGFEKYTIPSFTWAIFPCVGPMPEMIQMMWSKIYTEWLPNSGYELIPSYDIEFYTEGDIKSNTYRSEIWLPVRKK